GTAEQADLAALRERDQKVDDLDASDEQLLAARLFVVRRCWSVNRPEVFRLNRALLVLRRAEDVHDAAERRLADGHRDRRAGRAVPSPSCCCASSVTSASSSLSAS